MRSARLAVVLDIGCGLVFVIIGRASHTQGESLAGVASTAWPFLAGLAGGWLATAGLAGRRAWRQPFRLWPAGVGAGLGAVVLGIAFLGGSRPGTATALGGVAPAFLRPFLLRWRLLAPLTRLRQ